MIQTVQKLGDNETELVQQLAELDVDLISVEESANAIQSAVATIAAFLPEQETHCPVCQTHHEASHLKYLARQSAERSDLRLAQMKQRREALVVTRQELAKQKSGIEARLADLVLHRKELAKVSLDLDSRERSLRISALLTNQPIEHFGQLIASAIESVNQRLATLTAEIDGIGELAVADAERDRLTTKVDALTDDIARQRKLIQHLDNAVSDLSNRRSRIAASLGLVLPKDLQPDISDAEAMLDVIQQEENSKAEALASATKARIQAETLAQEVRQEYDSIYNRLELLLLEQTNICARWQGDGFSGDPTPLNLSEILVSLRVRQQQCLNLIEQVKSLVVSCEIWQQQQELKNTEDELHNLRERFNASGLFELRAQFNQEIARLRRELEQLGKVKEHREQIRDLLENQASELETQTFVPLNACLERFSATLMTGWEQRVELKSVFGAANAATSLLLWPNFQEMAGEGHDPLLYLSEGQIAALGIALLFSASVTYPWSRWRALLLDDPLQHNDTIHGAALIDVIRNLVREKGYQILISTHDLEEAGYFLRKCANAGIATRYCHLVTRSSNGVFAESG